MDLCIIYNPAAGRGRAERLVKRLRRARTVLDLRPMTRPGHGAELARQAIDAGHRRIVAAGGDGTVHEVANGILESNHADVVFGVWPIGSANDYAYALGIRGDWPLRPAWPEWFQERYVDVGRVTGGGRTRYFVNGLGLGFNAAVTFEAQSISGLRGMALYGVAFLRALWRHYRFPRLVVQFDDHSVEQPTLALTVNLGKREGGFLVTPHADLSDGLFDVVHAGPISRARALSLLPRLATGTLPADHPLIRQSRCRHVAIRGSEPLQIHIDGEFFCLTQDNISDVAIELLPNRLRVLAPRR